MRDSKFINIIMCHPDDEIIFGWPILKKALHEHLSLRILMLVDDKVQYKDRRIKAFHKTVQILKESGITIEESKVCTGRNSNFYKNDIRDGTMMNVVADVDDFLKNQENEKSAVFTHNLWGEYGHRDHIECNNIVTQISLSKGLPIFMSDMTLIDTPWSFTSKEYFGKMSPVYSGFFENAEEYEMCNEIQKIYKLSQLEYQRLGVWTWSKKPILSAKIARFGGFDG